MTSHSLTSNALTGNVLTSNVDNRADAAFIREVRRVLHHLYTPLELLKSPLIKLFALEQHTHPPSALRRTLLDGVQRLKPDTQTPLQTKEWRAYQVLQQRFQEQFTQQEVAADLGLSIRHLRREETLAIQLLADYLWRTYRPAGYSQWVESSKRKGDQAAPSMPAWRDEMAWLQGSLPSEPVAVVELLHAVLQLVQPLAEQAQATIHFKAAEHLLLVDVQRTTLRQALLHILTAAIHRAPCGQVSVTVQAEQQSLQIEIQARQNSPASPRPDEEIWEHLTLAQQLSQLSLGVLTVVQAESSASPFIVQLRLPMVERIPTLIIDDNADTRQLLQRYLVNSRYHFIGVADPRQVLAYVEKYHPQVIVLDVMLPEIDGWELLGRLREHPVTRNAPLIVCTILPQEQLALALGATAFVRKPISQRAFLAVLDRQFDHLSKESH